MLRKLFPAPRNLISFKEKKRRFGQNFSQSIKTPFFSLMSKNAPFSRLCKAAVHSCCTVAVCVSMAIFPCTARTQTPASTLPLFGHERSVDTLRIGVHYSDLSDFRTRLMEPTVERLKKHFPNLHIEIAALNEFDLNVAVVRHDVDLFVISSGFFTYLEPTGVTGLALRKSPQSSDAGHATGAVFVARSDNTTIDSLTDLRSKRVAASSAQSFSGWMAALGEIANLTQYPKNYFGKAYYKHTSGMPIASAVLNREVDFGILRTCELEALVSRGKIARNALKVINSKADETFACERSTKLYPDLIFAARADLSEELKRKISSLLLTMPVDQSGYGWTVMSNLRDAQNLINRMGYSPTASLTNHSSALDRYKYALLIGVLLLVAAMSYSFLISRVVAQRTKKLVEVIDEKSVLEKNARIDRERLSQLERAGFVSEISSMIAHELRQPVASLINYADGLALYLSDKEHDPVIHEATREIAKQAERVASIVERVRDYAKNSSKAHRTVNLCDIVKHAFRSFRSGSDLAGVRIFSDLPESAYVSGDALELELLVVNCLKNALQAVKRNAGGCGEIRIELSTNSPAGYFRLSVRDNGPAITDEQFEMLARPVTSDKIEGLGLGLSISRIIAERHAARLEFERLPSRGLAVSLLIAEQPLDNMSHESALHPE